MKAIAMEDENPKFSVLTEIFSQFTEENRDNLLKAAERLLNVQQGDSEVPTGASVSPIEAERQKRA